MEVPPPAAAPDVSPEAPLDDLPAPLAPEVPEVPEVPLAPDDEPLGVVAELPLPPVMPVSLLPLLLPVAPVWPAGLDALGEDLLVSVDELCASAIEDTDAINTSDNDRSVDFNAMENSFD